MASHRPQIASFPAAAAVGDTIVLNGQDLAGTSAVTINGTPAASFVALDRTLSIVIDGGTTTGRIAVTNTHGTTTSKTELAIKASAPAITLVAPLTGKAGDSIAVTGTDFLGTTGVKIGGVATAFTVESDTLIRLTLLAGMTTGTVAVTGPGGTGTSASTVTYVPTPSIHSVAPRKLGAGASLAIVGSGFTAASAVTVGGTAAASFVTHSDVSITAVVGSGTTGAVTVTNANGTGTSVDSVTVLPAPTITSFTPTVGPARTVVVVTGTNLATTTGVTFNGTRANIIAITATKVTAVVPQGATAGKIAITTLAGTVTSTPDFTPGEGPEIDYVDPVAAEIGDTVTVAGIGLSDASSVTLGGVAMTGLVVASDVSLSAVIAAATPSGHLKVTSPEGVATSEQTITIVTAPVISARSPSSGAAGAAVLITGTHFDGVTDVKFNGTSAAFAVLSSTQIRATVPTAATTGVITVINGAGTGTSASFTKL